MEQYVSTFEEACARLNKGTELPDVSQWPERLQKHLTALFKLDTILQVNNGDWKPDLGDTEQWKYYPWFDIDSDGSSGFALSYGDCVYGVTRASVGVRLSCKDEELAKFMGTTFPELYKDLLS